MIFEILILLVTVVTTSFAQSCYRKATNYDDEGQGDMVYFDRHRLRCGDRVMRWFKLDRGENNTIRFEYECCNERQKLDTREFQTFYTNDGDGNLVFLEKQNMVSCGPYGILSGFNLLRNRKRDSVRFNVICNQYRGLACLSQQTTPFDIDGGGKSVYLDRHKVECSSNHYLNRFRLQRSSDHKRIRIVYRCCRSLLLNE